jgi:hypothetical protein
MRLRAPLPGLAPDARLLFGTRVLRLFAFGLLRTIAGT